MLRVDISKQLGEFTLAASFTSERRVTVTAGGSQIVKFDLNTEAPGDQGLFTVHSNMPRAMAQVSFLFFRQCR